MSYILVVWLLIGFFINTILSLPIMFSKSYRLDWELFLATTLTWPFTVVKAIRSGLNDE